MYPLQSPSLLLPFGLLPLPLLQCGLIQFLRGGPTHGPQSLQGSADVALYNSHSHLEVHLLQHSLIQGPQSLQGCTCCAIDISMATDASAPTCSYPQTQILRVELLLQGLTHRSGPFHSSWHWSCSLCDPAVTPRLWASPGTLPGLLSKCSQAQLGRMISPIANSQSEKKPLTSSRLMHSKASKTYGKHSLPIDS